MCNKYEKGYNYSAKSKIIMPRSRRSRTRDTVKLTVCVHVCVCVKGVIQDFKVGGGE